ncbi:MAG: SpoIIE family protein phosphatase [Lachnospirales bacterium]
MKTRDKFLKWLKSSKTVFGAIGFILGRVIFFSDFNPIALGFTTSFFGKREFNTVAFFTALGLLTVANKINVFRYIFAIIMMTLFNYCLKEEKVSKLKISALLSLSVFSGGIVYTLFSNMSFYYAIMAVFETALAVVLFLIIRGRVGVFNIFDYNILQSKENLEHIKIVIAGRLKKSSDIFSNISDTYSSSLLIEEVEEEKTRDSIVENIKSNICSSCTFCDKCWKDNKAYNMLFSLTDVWLKEGVVKGNKLLSENCLKSGEIYMLSKGSVELYRLNKLWLKKAEQSKLLIGRQLGVISELLEELNKEVTASFNIDNDLSNYIFKSLTASSVNSVVAIKGDKGYEVSVSVPHCYSCHSCGEEIGEHISEILDVKMIKTSFNCRNRENCCIINYRQAPKFRVAPFMTGIKRDGSPITGDSFTYMDLGDGKYLLALADGMGSGTEASKESAASIEMYEDFMEAGFNRETALDIINSILLAANEKECFSTLDICTIDCYNGNAEFVKIGAVSTFIIRNNKVELIKASSLPVGILGDIDCDITNITLNKGDIIVMVTDGVLDSTGNVLRNEKWLKTLLEKNSKKSPETIANIVLKRAKENSHYTIRDDMTILAAQIY